MSITSFRGRYRFLSNFHPCPKGVLLEGHLYQTSEHAYVAAKTTSEEERHQISLLPGPGGAKQYGKYMVTRPDWHRVRLGLMIKIVTSKFERDEDLLELLYHTGDQNLVEGNTWHDNYWGNCTCGKRASCQGDGENNLGRILMSVRRVVLPPQHCRPHPSYRDREVQPPDNDTYYSVDHIAGRATIRNSKARGLIIP
jgi:ribA/ribD-fused uncharacterized protein